MLNDAQKRYLEMLSDTKVIYTKPYSPEAARVAQGLLKELQTAVPDLEVFWSGALALGISGKNDIDFSVVSRAEDYDKYLPALIGVLGEPQKRGRENVRWEIAREGHSVDVHLADERSPALAEHKRTHELLKNNPELLRKYEEIKQNASGLCEREYQRKKYEFYNDMLETFATLPGVEPGFQA